MTALLLALALVAVAAACGKAASRTPDAATDTTATTMAGATKASCPSGSFPVDTEGLPKGLKLTGTGNVPGWYLWFAGPFLRVRLVSDPAKPLAPVPVTAAPRSTKTGSPGVILSYTGELTTKGNLGKVTEFPDKAAGLIEQSTGHVAFALNGQATPVGFDVGVPCGTKSIQVTLNIPATGGPKPAGLDKIFVGRSSHPLENPVVLTRVADPDAPKTPAATKPKTTQPKATQPDTSAPTTTAP